LQVLLVLVTIRIARPGHQPLWASSNVWSSEVSAAAGAGTTGIDKSAAAISVIRRFHLDLGNVLSPFILP
jgi:hypothetical protein